MLKARYKKHTLQFKVPGGTSRGILKTKDTYYITISNNDKKGIGECGILRGLSADDVPEYEQVLKWTCININLGKQVLKNELIGFPSIWFGLEQAFLGLENQNPYHFYSSKFTDGLSGQDINGLIWMGDEAYMRKQVKDKLDMGFSCLKMKIGAIDWKTEKAILQSIRKEFKADTIELRVDANGAFSPQQAREVLKELCDLEIHSIEQPIKKGQPQEMAALCESTPIPIALDEELIGVFDIENQRELINTIRPQYIILKPSFIGGWSGSDQWIDIAEKNTIGWWMTSALESNIGLNAIAQYTAIKNNTMPQGLGTGNLFENNVPSPLFIDQGKIWMDPNKHWDTSLIDKI